jgi:hypothetical protein
MTKSRRAFLQAGATATLVAAIPQIILGAQPTFLNGLHLPITTPRSPITYLRRSSFTPYVNSIFEVPVKRGLFTRSLPLTLIRVDDAGWEPRRQPTKVFSAPVKDEHTFSLLFRSSLRTPLTQDVYDLRHPALGIMNVLLVPVVSRDKKSGYYEVIFNRSRLEAK